MSSPAVEATGSVDGPVISVVATRARQQVLDVITPTSTPTPVGDATARGWSILGLELPPTILAAILVSTAIGAVIVYCVVRAFLKARSAAGRSTTPGTQQRPSRAVSGSPAAPPLGGGAGSLRRLKRTGSSTGSPANNSGELQRSGTRRRTYEPEDTLKRTSPDVLDGNRLADSDRDLAASTEWGDPTMLHNPNMKKSTDTLKTVEKKGSGKR